MTRRRPCRVSLAKPLDCVQPAAALVPQPAAGERSLRELEGTLFRIVSPPPASRLADESGSRLRAVQGLRRKTGLVPQVTHGSTPSTARVRGFGLRRFISAAFLWSVDWHEKVHPPQRAGNKNPCSPEPAALWDGASSKVERFRRKRRPWNAKGESLRGCSIFPMASLSPLIGMRPRRGRATSRPPLCRTAYSSILSRKSSEFPRSSGAYIASAVAGSALKVPGVSARS